MSNYYPIPVEKHNFFLIAGPCVVESKQMVMDIAGALKEITGALQIPLVFKASYRKANRTSLKSFTGIGDKKALEILSDVKTQYRIPVITDIHSAAEAAMAARYVDILQIPAFLSRQTDLLIAAAKTGKVVNIKKGQFMSPESMQFALEKVKANSNNQVLLTERGTMFGYQDLVVDFRGIPTMRQFGVPVVLDCTHSLQQPNQTSGVTGGRPAMIQTIAQAGIAAGADGLFIETHPEPSRALSDGANMLPLSDLAPLLERCLSIREALSKYNMAKLKDNKTQIQQMK